MNLVQASKASAEKLEHFLQNNPNLNEYSLLQRGYVVELQGEIEGCFILEEMEKGTYWLKQLYITQSEAAVLPVLLESILTMAKQQHAQRVYVHSHQPVVDILLEALQFHPQKERAFVNKYDQRDGNWWLYHVS
ncbi:hypothetical protein KM914_08860 [Virgibacillus pantothenticus]|uniref:N-acetyltransferase domain-containing protein n=1 Tax=Virgibacillus pantothenticus TaxID=1473 RepID=A0A0L0QSH2_VIRPA|nr:MULTISPECIES: hypothetical protein [Virgibacillus]API91834.1 hypothetical protein BKP57_08330 [Virgibacillus sp. 6R]KNE21526.1 hypothetical protein AFK71_07685 [Virgibacillus pantothenticus]MBS7430278.1 hypothetical protein [Virgibacillus sp. 19R1-5]MBU8566541.1 hypothetical protein [Virgibacillus pantothenticus]MBU8599033.1 hypothetical protein [Virgibacillus pantothenticus]